MKKQIEDILARFPEEQAHLALRSVVSNPQNIKWLLVKAIMDRHFNESAEPRKEVIELLCKQFSNCQSILVYLYIYRMHFDGILRLDNEKDSYFNLREQFKEISGIVANLQEPHRAHTVQLILETVPKLWEHPKQCQLRIAIQCFYHWKIESQWSCRLFLTFIKSISYFSFETEQKEPPIMMFLRIVVETTIRSEGVGCMALLIDEPLLHEKPQAIISYCKRHRSWLMSRSDQELLRLFENLTRSSMNFYVLQFLEVLTNIFIDEKYFYHLVLLYQRIILPRLALRAKCCLISGVSNSLFKLVRLYVLGFSEFCKIGEAGLYCLTKDVHLIQDKKTRMRWLSLCFHRAQAENIPEKVLELLKEDGVGKQELREAQSMQEDLGNRSQYLQILELNFSNEPWKVTERNLRRRKMYPENNSLSAGIENEGNQCYIISIVQALFSISLFAELIEKIHTKPGQVNWELQSIFRALTWRNPYNLRVTKLQQAGPRLFAYSRKQEDAQQYLIQLLEQIEKQLTSVEEKKKFTDIFKSQVESRITCAKCNHSNPPADLPQFCHSIALHEKLQENWTNKIRDAKCEKCKHNELINNSRIKMHLNRFKVEHAVTSKQLALREISRKLFSTHGLAGMVFHIGSSMQFGHYIYYAKVGARRWARMSDSEVVQFDLEAEEEPFEKELQEQFTPYLLFYNRKV